MFMFGEEQVLQIVQLAEDLVELFLGLVFASELSIRVSAIQNK